MVDDDKPRKPVRPLKEVLAEFAEHPEVISTILQMSSVADAIRSAIRKAAKHARKVNAQSNTVQHRESRRARRQGD